MDALFAFWGDAHSVAFPQTRRGATGAPSITRILCRLLPYVALDPAYRTNFCPVDNAIAIGNYAFRCACASAVRIRIRNEGSDFAGTGVTDSDAAQPGAMCRVNGSGLGIRCIEDVVVINVETAIAAELMPAVQQGTFLIEDLDAVVATVGYKQSALGVHCQ